MGKAYTCDRCCRLFKREDYAEKVSVVLESCIPFGIDFGNATVYISLCPSCRASFQRWWDKDAVHKVSDPKSPHVDLLYDYTVDEENKDG